MLVEPAPRSLHGVSSIAAKSGTKFVSHMFWPARTNVRSPSPDVPGVLADTIREKVVIVEDETLVVVELHHQRQVA